MTPSTGPYRQQQKSKIALGIYDPLSAMVSDHAGADFLWLSSYSVSSSHGIPDIGALPLPLQEQLITRILAVTGKPLIVDADNASASERWCNLLVDRLRHLGAVGLAIEDKADPKESSLYPAKQRLRSPEEFAAIIQKIRHRNQNLLVLARLEGLNYGEHPEVIIEKARLCSAYVDYVILHNTSTHTNHLEPLIEACSKLAPIALIPTTYMDRLNGLSAYPVDLLIFANQLLRARLKACREAATTLMTSPASIDQHLDTTSALNKFIGV